MLAHQPTGPFYLGGYCAGAIIAYEMAQLLKEKGHEIGMLALIDQRNLGRRLTLRNVVPALGYSVPNIWGLFRDQLTPCDTIQRIPKSIGRLVSVWWPKRDGGNQNSETGSVAMNITRLPPSKKTVQVQAEIPISQRDEFDRTMMGIVAGERPRMNAMVLDEAAIDTRAMQALQLIEATINAHPSTDQSRRLVRFLAGVYSGSDYPFDLTELRRLDTKLANACLDYLNYDRLGKRAVHKHLANGDGDLHRWLEQDGIETASRS
jgi:Thioesterase domain